ncbi:hypothetical protein [Sphingobacterium sp. IITKGP-BTPF85]|uniref:hypothetical protein n=1 Tax=Sphingobacterium sp. IITKGP-BTPF85 TaxID=1338009 RepID=UPI000389DEDB|nr:hypothetical protein [Sphingobacterium sp. IITKGP-BTPF85]KKX51739.1 hypothetical protein L950_0203790 [Sphingobacterium sp. IITKGP-BTPF85]
MKLNAKNLKQKFILYKTPIAYTMSSVVKALATLTTGFIIARFIAPNDFGLWSTFSLLISYALVFQGGVINGLNLELPLSLGKGDIKKSNLYVGVAQVFTLFASIMILFLALMVFFFYSFNNDKEKYGFWGYRLLSFLLSIKIFFYLLFDLIINF